MIKKYILLAFGLILSYNANSQVLNKNYDNNGDVYYYSNDLIDFSSNNYQAGFVVGFGYVSNVDKIVIPIVYFNLPPCVVKGLLIIRFETGEAIYLMKETNECENSILFVVKRQEHIEMLSTRSVKSIEFSHIGSKTDFYEYTYGKDRTYFINMIKELNKEL